MPYQAGSSAQRIRIGLTGLAFAFLAVCLIRLLKGDFTPQKHFGFEAAAWYWHFVDVVWLFLFSFIYVIFGMHGH